MRSLGVRFYSKVPRNTFLDLFMHYKWYKIATCNFIKASLIQITQQT